MLILVSAFEQGQYTFETRTDTTICVLASHNTSLTVRMWKSYPTVRLKRFARSEMQKVFCTSHEGTVRKGLRIYPRMSQKGSEKLSKSSRTAFVRNYQIHYHPSRYFSIRLTRATLSLLIIMLSRFRIRSSKSRLLKFESFSTKVSSVRALALGASLFSL
jgi:hypothetical protein